MTRKHTSFLLAVVVLALTSNAIATTTWYVNGVSGSDSNNCKSSTTPCKTIGHAISLALSGDTIKVAAATYKENLTIGLSLSIVGASAATTIIDGVALRLLSQFPVAPPMSRFPKLQCVMDLPLTVRV